MRCIPKWEENMSTQITLEQARMVRFAIERLLRDGPYPEDVFDQLLQRVMQESLSQLDDPDVEAALLLVDVSGPVDAPAAHRPH
jgi:hypothetical protein